MNVSATNSPPMTTPAAAKPDALRSLRLYTAPRTTRRRGLPGRYWVACLLAAVTSAAAGAGIGLAERHDAPAPSVMDARPDRDDARQLGAPDDRFYYMWSFGFSTGLHGVQMYDRKIDHAGPGGFRQEEVWNNLPGYVTGSTYFEEMSEAFCTDDTTRRQTWFCLRTAHDLLGVGVQRGIAIFSRGGFSPTHTFGPDGSFNVGIQHNGSARATIYANGSAHFGAITVASCTGCGYEENIFHLAIAALLWAAFGFVVWRVLRNDRRAKRTEAGGAGPS